MNPPLSADYVNAPAANTAAVVTLLADGAGREHVISGVGWSYSAAPTSGLLTVKDGTNVVQSYYVTAAGPGVIQFPEPVQGSPNTPLIVTLSAGGGGVSGSVNVFGHTVTTQMPNNWDILPDVGQFDFSSPSESLWFFFLL